MRASPVKTPTVVTPQKPWNWPVKIGRPQIHNARGIDPMETTDFQMVPLQFGASNQSGTALPPQEWRRNHLCGG